MDNKQLRKKADEIDYIVQQLIEEIENLENALEKSESRVEELEQELKDYIDNAKWKQQT